MDAIRNLAAVLAVLTLNPALNPKTRFCIAKCQVPRSPQPPNRA